MGLLLSLAVGSVLVASIVVLPLLLYESIGFIGSFASDPMDPINPTDPTDSHG